MMDACRQFLIGVAESLVLPDGVTHPFRGADDEESGLKANILFEELPLDYLKDNDFAICCLPLQDRLKPMGRRIARVRNQDATAYTNTWRRFSREILFRCLVYAPKWEQLWGATGYPGMVDQFQQTVAGTRIIAAGDNSAVRIVPQENVRPVDGQAEQNKKLRRSYLGIARVGFTGGIQVEKTDAIIQSFSIEPKISSAARTAQTVTFDGVTVTFEGKDVIWQG